MKSIIVTIIFLAISLDVSSQGICNGNLGDNIFERGDFGSGSTPVLANNPNIAPGYNYTTSVPYDGSYTICSNTGALSGLFPTWLAVTDNSDDPNGYMMVVNASYDPGIFYEEVVDGLCENTLYEFSADILNLIRIGTPNHIDPNVSFLIDNVEVYNTGNISKTESWKQYGFTFVTTSVQSSIRLTLRNNAPGGGGNDLALDNISFRPCGPSSFIGIESDTTIFLCIDDDPLTVVADIQAGNGQEFAIQWQSSTNGVDWITLEESTNSTITHTNFVPGNYYYRYFSAGNEINILNEKCRIISDVIEITILPDTYFVSDTICLGLVYEFGDQQLTTSGSHTGTFNSQYGCDSIVFLDLAIVSPQEIIFEDIFIQDPTCFGFEDGVIEVNSIIGGYGGLSYSILEGSNSVSGSSFSAGNYSIYVEDKYQCSDVLPVQLLEPPEISVFLGQDTTIKLGDELNLNPIYSTEFESFQWTGQGEFNCLDCQDPSYIPFFSGNVNITATNEAGCEAKDSVRVNVDDQNFIVLPNIFSPNDDGINDFFTINYYGQSVSEVNSFAVFDRWGGKVFSIKNSDIKSGGNLWDGYVNSRKASTGVYVYKLELTLINGVKITKIGDVTVLN